jgi:hypothetical protein
VLAAQLGAGAAFACACADQLALYIRQPAKHGNHQPPRAGRCVRPRLREAEELPARVDDIFDDGEKRERGSREPVNARDHHLIARREGFQKPAKFLAVNLRAGSLLAMDAQTPRRLELVELRFKGLPDGRDAGIAVNRHLQLGIEDGRRAA